MTNQKSLHNLIKSISGQANILAIPRLYLNLVGNDHAAAFFLSQAVYWSDRSAANGGWFWKSYDDWQEEIGLSQYQIKRAATVCAEWVEVKLKKASGAPTLHYRVNIDSLTNSIIKFLDNRETSLSRNSKMDYEETSQSLTETTTEITKNLACEETASEGQPEQQALPTIPTVANPLTAKKPRQLMTEEEAAVVNVWTNVNIQPPIPANDAPVSEFKAFRKLWLSPVQQVIKAANGRSKEVILKAIQEQKRKGIAYGQPVSVLKRALEIAAELTPVKPAGEVTAAQAAAAIAAKTWIQFDD